MNTMKSKQLTNRLMNIKNEWCIKFVWGDIFATEALKTR